MKTELKPNHEWYQVQTTVELKDGTIASVVEMRQRPISKKKDAPVAPVVKKERKVRHVSGVVSKKEAALQLYRDLFEKGHGKETTIQRFVDVLNMTRAGATTYFYNCKKAV